MTIPASEKSQQASAAAYLSWAATENRTARTAAGRAAFENRFLEAAGGDPQRAAALRKAYFKQLVLKSVQARRRRREAAHAKRKAATIAMIRELGAADD